MHNIISKQKLLLCNIKIILPLCHKKYTTGALYTVHCTVQCTYTLAQGEHWWLKCRDSDRTKPPFWVSDQDWFLCLIYCSCIKSKTYMYCCISSVFYANIPIIFSTVWAIFTVIFLSLTYWFYCIPCVNSKYRSLRGYFFP